MVKLLIFDMDGTLIELKDVHYEALNRSLAEVDEKYVITREEHEEKYDGLPTIHKLNMLTVYKGLSISEYDRIWRRKQEITASVIRESNLVNPIVNKTIHHLKDDGFKIVVASNSIRETVKAALEVSELIHFVDDYLSNEDVAKAKPDPEIFFLAMKRFGVSENETMIFEDSKYGLEAARATGAYVYEVKNSGDILYDPIRFKLDYIKDSHGFYR